ncbi:HNH endonuclease [Clostridium intestinale]|uniref:HNH endonuclease n=1 Tax=Clostridium intestinale TaxID=36845 RepID=UPI002DD67BB5|nr:HNH endonuclease [Clostridium intestinale]WRY50710.1 HNH endonuclease [Clostridium intestinale]
MLEEIYKKYGLTKNHLANLLSKTEKAIDDELMNTNQLSKALVEILATPSKLLKLLNDNKDNIPFTIYKRAKSSLETEIVNQFSEVFKNRAFVKQVKSNELGFRNGISGRAGSFILVPKNCLEIFPELSEIIENDKQTIRVSIEPERETRLIEFTYHNSKITQGDETGRDEFRLYNNNFINGRVLLSPEDIIIMMKDLDDNGEFYHLYRFSQNSEEHEKLLQLIIKYKNGRAFATMIPISEFILNGFLINEVLQIDDIEQDNSEEDKVMHYDEIDNFELSKRSLEKMMSQDVQENVEVVLRKIKQIKRNMKFRKLIVSAYENKCSITGLNISYNGVSNIQACHIIGKSYGGSDNPTNGIALDMNLHWAFDKGMFTINDSYEVEVHPLMAENEILRGLNGTKIFLPKDERYHPSKDALEYHRTKIFGEFLRN